MDGEHTRTREAGASSAAARSCASGAYAVTSVGAAWLAVANPRAAVGDRIAIADGCLPA